MFYLSDSAKYLVAKVPDEMWWSKNPIFPSDPLSLKRKNRKTGYRLYFPPWTDYVFKRGLLITAANQSIEKVFLLK